MHFGRRRSPDYQRAVDPDVETIVASAVKLDGSSFRQIPESMPARAEEAPRKGRVLIQEP